MNNDPLGYGGFQAYTPAASQKKKKGFWQDQISTGGGMAGAVGGAALGTAILPGLGTLAGALIGGFTGGAAGQRVENAVVGDDLNKDVLKEGLINGVFGAGPIRGASVLAKGGMAAVKGASVREGMEQGLTATPVRDLIGDRFGTLGTNLQRGVANTTKVADSFTQEKSLLDALNRNGLHGSAARQYRDVDGAISRLSTRIGDELAVVGTSAPRKTVISNLQASTADLLPSDTTYVKELTRSLERLSKSSDGAVGPKELFAFKKELNARLSNAFGKLQRGAPLTAKEEVDMALWQQLDKQITSLAPKVKQMTLDQSKLITVRPGLQAGGRKTAGIPAVGLQSTGVESGLQEIRDMSGRALQAASGFRLPGNGMNPVRMAGRVGVGGAMFNPGAGPDMQNEQPLDQAPQDMSLDQALMGGEQMPQQSNPFGVSQDQVAQQMMLALQAGDREGFNQLKTMYELIGDYEAAAGGGSLSATAAEAAAKSSNADSTLMGLEQLLSQAGGAGGPLGGGFAGLMGKAGLNNNVKAYNDLADGSISQIARALGETGTISDGDRIVYGALLPRVTDTPEVAAMKFEELRRRMAIARANTLKYGSGSTASVEDAMLQN